MLAEHSIAAAQRRVTWGQILLAGGAGWMVVTITVILWMWPLSGSEVDNTYYLSTPARIFQHLQVFALSALAYRIAFSYLRPLRRRHPLGFIALHLLLALAVIVLAPLAAGLSAGLIDGRHDDLRDSLRYWLTFSSVMGNLLNPMQFFLPPYLLGMALIALLQVAREYHDESLRSARLWAAYSEARLAMLSAQLQPHFLFNALHAIMELIEQSPARATTMVARLGDFLRHALENSKQAWGSVATEIAGLEAYLAVQEARYGDRLAVNVAIEPATQQLAIPSMLLQPLVENAIEHGRGGPSSILNVSIAVTLDAGRIRVVIGNSEPAIPAALTPALYRTGLNNVQARLRAAYEAGATLTVRPSAGGGTEAILELPVRPSQ